MVNFPDFLHGIFCTRHSCLIHSPLVSHLWWARWGWLLHFRKTLNLNVWGLSQLWDFLTSNICEVPLDGQWGRGVDFQNLTSQIRPINSSQKSWSKKENAPLSNVSVITTQNTSLSSWCACNHYTKHQQQLEWSSFFPRYRNYTRVVLS